MEKINLYSVGKICQIETNMPDLTKKLKSAGAKKFIGKGFPGGGIRTTSASADVRLGVYQSDKYSIVEDYPTFNVFAPKTDYKDIVALSDYLLERARQEVGIYNLHSSTVGTDKSCMVIHGASKSGKTVVSIDTNQNHGLEFLANERTLINLKNQQAVGGCSRLILEPYHKTIFPKLKKIDELELNEMGNSTHKIKGIVYPSIDTGQKKLIVDQKDPVKAEWILYPELTSRIRGTNKRMFQFSYPLDSLDTKEIAQKRIEELAKFLEKTPFYFVRGKKEDISAFIKDQL